MWTGCWLFGDNYPDFHNPRSGVDYRDSTHSVSTSCPHDCLCTRSAHGVHEHVCYARAARAQLSAAQAVPEQLDAGPETVIGTHVFLDLVDGMDHRGVVTAAEVVANLYQ
jgi:hypothetical protein